VGGPATAEIGEVELKAGVEEILNRHPAVGFALGVALQYRANGPGEAGRRPLLRDRAQSHGWFRRLRRRTP
jgi:hypothetical protein